MRPHPSLLALSAATLALLAACTGTVEPTAAVRLGLVTGGGTLLRVVAPSNSGGNASLSVTGAVDTETLPGGTQQLIAYTDHLELRDRTLGTVTALALPSSASFTPCFVRLRASPARDRVAALSDCGNGASEQVVMYRSDGTLAFFATVPPPTPSVSDDTRMAVTTTQTVWIAHPAVGGGSEFYAANENGIQLVNTAAIPANIYDLAMRGAVLYAATDAGVQPVDQTSGALGSAVLSGRQDRLWGGDSYLASWRSDATSRPLTIWNGSTFGVAAYYSDLRDLTFGPDANAYAMTASTVTQLNTSYGLSGSGWQASDVVTGLSDARAITWQAP